MFLLYNWHMIQRFPRSIERPYRAISPLDFEKVVALMDGLPRFDADTFRSAGLTDEEICNLPQIDTTRKANVERAKERDRPWLNATIGAIPFRAADAAEDDLFVIAEALGFATRCSSPASNAPEQEAGATIIIFPSKPLPGTGVESSPSQSLT